MRLNIFLLEQHIISLLYNTWLQFEASAKYLTTIMYAGIKTHIQMLFLQNCLNQKIKSGRFIFCRCSFNIHINKTSSLIIEMKFQNCMLQCLLYYTLTPVFSPSLDFSKCQYNLSQSKA